MRPSFEPEATLDELEMRLGQQFRALRIRREIVQKDLAEKAGVSLSALRSLETGRGVSLKTMLGVLRALGRTEFLDALVPEPSVSPMQMLRATKGARQRAYAPRKPRVPA
jgi:transcriptional regulator with XRE-family HTH domain